MEGEDRRVAIIGMAARFPGARRSTSTGPTCGTAGTGMHLYSLQPYLLCNLDGLADPDDPVTALQLVIGNQPDFTATPAAYRLGLNGPAVSEQIGCSTSL